MLNWLESIFLFECSISNSLRIYFVHSSTTMQKNTRTKSDFLLILLPIFHQFTPIKKTPVIKISLFCFLQGKFLVENRSKGIIIGNQTLVLQKVNRHQAGLYTCVASNQVGDEESNAQYLDVKCKYWILLMNCGTLNFKLFYHILLKKYTRIISKSVSKNTSIVLCKVQMLYKLQIFTFLNFEVINRATQYWHA